MNSFFRSYSSSLSKENSPSCDEVEFLFHVLPLIPQIHANGWPTGDVTLIIEQGVSPSLFPPPYISYTRPT